MPVAFLTDDHLARYGRYADDPTPEQLTEHFYLQPSDLERLALLRQDHTRLGFALQLCTLRFLGTFLQDPLDVPPLVLKTVAQQLGLTETLSLHRYLDRRETRFDHQRLIRDYLGYKDFAGLEVFALIRSIYAQLRLGDERPIALFDQATKTLALRKVILPGASVLARLIVRIRDRTLGLLYHQLSARLNIVQRTSLEDLLILPEGSGRSPLEKLRTPPTRVNAPGLVGALERISEVRAVGVGEVKLEDLPPGRLLALSRHALLSWTQTLARLSEPRRLATLLAFMQYLERSATDDALELFDTLMSSLAPRGERKRNKERLRTLRDLDAAALVLRDVGRLVLNEQLSSGRIRKEAFKSIGQDTILAANTTVTELVQEDTSEETENWLEAVHVVTRFLPTLLSTLKFEGTPGMKPLLEAITFLQKPHRTKSVWRQAPRDFIPKSWESRVLPLGRDPNRGAYSVCVAYLLHAALKRRDLFVARSHRFGDPRIQLLQGESWEALRGDVCRTLNLSPVASEAIQSLTVQLEAAYRRTLEGLPGNAWVRFETQDGRSIPIVQALEPQENTVRLEAMSDRAYSFIPDVDLSELLLEIHAQTGFADEFSLASEGEGRVSDFAKSLCAVLVSQACNIGLKAVSRPGIPALSLGRLSWVQQNYLRADTLIRANARLVEAHTDLPLARKWGDGEVASADGLRFVVPVRTVYSRPNSKYFGAGRGITYYSFTSDQFSAFHGLVIPGTLRDSLYILSGLLEQQTVLQPKELMSDTAGYSDVVFGLFHLLGYQFSPRLADLEHVRYWRIDRSQDYGLLEDVARNRVNTALIGEHWDDVLRLVGSLKLGTVKAPDILRTLAREGSLSGLGRAVAEVGRISKTLYLLEYLHDEGYRRRIQIQLNRTELRHRLARAIYHGHKGEMRQKYREGMEDQLGALGLVVNAVVLWNTRYLGASLEWLEAISDEVHPDDIPRLSPLRFAHINMLGRYHFEVNADVAAGMLRPLRDPDSTDAFETAWNER